MVSIQFGAALAKQLFPLIGAPGVTVLRTVFAAAILLVLWRPWKQRWNRAQLLVLLCYGAALGIMNYLFYLALRTIPLGLAVALEFTGPLAVSLLSSKKWTDLVWVFLAGLGIYLILPHSQLEGALDPTGVLFALGAGFFWALYIWFGKSASEHEHGGRTTAMGMTIAALTVLPFGLAESGSQLFSAEIFWSVLTLGLLVALLSSAIPYSLEMKALKKIPVKTFGILMSLEPVIATLAGWVSLQEKLTIVQLASVICIVIASLGSNFTSRQPVSVETA